MDRLKGKTALITGGNSGIGLASAELFISEGARVIISGRNQAAIEEAVAQLGENAVGIKCDVASMSELDALFLQINEQFGSLDIVFANAGIMSVATFQDSTEEHFDREFDINVKGLFFTVQKSLPLLKDGGSVILTYRSPTSAAPRLSISTARPRRRCVPLRAVGPPISKIAAFA
jgi:NAD(P)-dependent dehydrogenase (short-subunit alcohol dehydrogenase family)